MKVRLAPDSAVVRFFAVFLTFIAIGAWLRLDQLTLQVLLDDEWHVIHQLLVKDPRALFLTFGHADFSIPLALMYWLELKLFGLSEFGMRWPMMLAGLSALLVFPLYVRRYFDQQTTLVFTLLLAISPMLVLYSRTARPYALTLLLSFLALGAFQRFVSANKSAWKPGIAYVLCATASGWLHLVSLPLVVAPFVAFGLPALVNRNLVRVRRIFLLGMVTLAGLLALLLPPVLAHPEALGGRLGVQLPELQTYFGVWYFWLGTSSSLVVFTGVFLAAIGAGPVARTLPLFASLLIGLGLTFSMILLTQPAWVHNPLTLARYLLPAIPLLLLLIAQGATRLSAAVALQWGQSGKRVALAAGISVMLLVTYYSPLGKILAKPNSNSLHSAYQFDFRSKENLIALYQDDFPVSPFWQRLQSFPRDSLKIAASPFSFETHHWDAARWEQISRQRVMPGYLSGFCAEHRWGEVPRGGGFNFRNAGYLMDRRNLVDRGFDLVVYQKPLKVMTYEGEKEFGMDTIACDAVFRKQFSTPVYEDELLVVFPLSEAIKELWGQSKGAE